MAAWLKVLLVEMAVLVVLCKGLKKGDDGVCEHQRRKLTRIPDCKIMGRNNCRRFQIVHSYSCCHMWEYDIMQDKCNPICTNECSGTNACVSPGICRCYPPLKLLNGYCVPPVCEPNCGNASCIDTNTCECLPGFRALNASLCLQYCGPGYMNDPIECRPVCSTPCRNAFCTAPDTCTCLPGYVEGDDGSCTALLNETSTAPTAIAQTEPNALETLSSNHTQQIKPDNRFMNPNDSKTPAFLEATYKVSGGIRLIAINKTFLFFGILLVTFIDFFLIIF